jgi:hypothetical protein
LNSWSSCLILLSARITCLDHHTQLSWNVLTNSYPTVLLKKRTNSSSLTGFWCSLLNYFFASFFLAAFLVATIPLCFSMRWISYFTQISGITWYLSFCILLVLFNIRTSRSIHVATNDRISLGFFDRIIFFCVYIPHFHHHVLTDGHLGWFHMSFWSNNLKFFGYIHRGSIAGLNGSILFRVLRNFHTIFHNSYSNLQSHKYM